MTDASPADSGDRSVPASEAGSILTIDLSAIVDNWRALARRAAPACCAAVVKADGYGCGLAPVTRVLARAGCDVFFVAHLAEGRGVRVAAPRAAIYLLNGLLPGTAAAYAEAGLRPVLGSLAELEEWRSFTAASGWSGEAALHVDTGMNRLGLRLDEAAALAREPQAWRPNLLISHLACSEIADHPLNRKQMAAFGALRQMFPGIPGSLANSSGIFLGPDAHHDMVRPGLALYGANPTPGHGNPMRPVVELCGRIVQVRGTAAGETVGYGATWLAARPTRLAIIAIGYGDGFQRAASPRDGKPGAEAIVAGRRCPLAGVVSMDLLAIDVTDLPDGTVKRGETAMLIGGDIGVDEVAERAGTISYEILTSLGRRYTRIYRGDTEARP